MKNKPKFFIKANSQKGAYSFKDILNNNVLIDVCYKLTGLKEFDVVYDYKGYNKGRLAILEYIDKKYYISFSEKGKVDSRNAFFQSLTTALIMFHADKIENSHICFYFLETIGNIETNYHKFMYRLMATTGVEFINSSSVLTEEVKPFVSVDDLIMTRYKNKVKNKGNNSTYLTRNRKGETDIYAKTYGANKKESTLIALAVSYLVPHINLYEILEQNLTELPAKDKAVLLGRGNINIISTDRYMEEEQYEKNNSLRSPTFIYNLLKRLGPKKCALCKCEIPELIQGAHIWPVASIKKLEQVPYEEKLKYATDGNNGIWLCENHHKMFDEGIIVFDCNGKIYMKSNLKNVDYDYIQSITTNKNISQYLLSREVLDYFIKRYENFNLVANDCLEII